MSDTPETDAKWQELCCSNLSWYHIAENFKAHCQEKERERDEAFALLASEKITRNHIIKRSVEVERERDEAREAAGKTGND